MGHQLHIPIARYGLTDSLSFKGNVFIIIGIAYLGATRQLQYTLSMDDSTPGVLAFEPELSAI
jgi:hypothetical protein